MKRLVPLLLGVLVFLLSAVAGRTDDGFLGQTWMVDGWETGGQFAYAVAGIGDVNGDGYGDVAVGAPRVEPADGPYRAGAAYVYYGGAGGLQLQPTWQAAGSDTGVRFGHVVAAAGDVDGDGYDDLLVSAYRENCGFPEAGSLYLFRGSPFGLATAPAWQACGDRGGAQFGYAAAGAGDVNGDGYDDVVVGARWVGEAERLNLGAVYLYFGSAAGLGAAPAWQVVGDVATAALGSAVAGAGDVNGDGYADVLVGAPFYDGTFADEGLALLFCGAAGGPGGTADWTYAGGEENAQLGTAVAGAGDVNGDGWDDVVVGAPLGTGPAGGAGVAALFFGQPAGLPTTPGWTAAGSSPQAAFGIAVAGAGDVNRDGYADLAVGSSRYSDDQFEEGAVFVYLGTAGGLLPDPEWHATGNKAETQFGQAVAAAGDVNGDAYADLVVGAPQFRLESILVGRAFAFRGADVPLEYETWLPAIVRGRQ